MPETSILAELQPEEDPQDSGCFRLFLFIEGSHCKNNDDTDQEPPLTIVTKLTSQMYCTGSGSLDHTTTTSYFVSESVLLTHNH